MAPGIASAHIALGVPVARCLEGGGWEATYTVTFSDGPDGGIAAEFSSTYPPGTSVSYSTDNGIPRTFGAGVVIPVDVPSITFTASGTWVEDEGTASDTATVSQPQGCSDTTTTTSTTTTTTTTTTLPGATTTTTTLPGATTTTTTIAGDLSVTAITPICVRDAPYVQVTFGNQPELNGRPATVTFIDINGVVVATHTATYQANSSVTFVYPGATVDAAGNPTDWPGWVFDGDEWVPDPTDEYLRQGLTVRVEVNPTATGQVSYPPATSTCADPPGGSSSGGGLPVTGNSPTTGPTAAVAAAAVALGAAAIAFARRRPSRRP